MKQNYFEIECHSGNLKDKTVKFKESRLYEVSIL